MALQLLSLFEPVTVEEKCTQGWCSVGQEGRQSVVLCWERVLGMCVREGGGIVLGRGILFWGVGVGGEICKLVTYHDSNSLLH